MNRRDLLKSAACAATGAALLATTAESLLAAAPAKAAKAPAPFVETPDHVRLFCREWGEGKPVVFLHSWANNADLWQYQMVHLSEHGMRCIAYDRRGHGRSTDPGRGFDFDTLAGDLAVVLDAFDVHRATLIGHSMGCAEIVRYVARFGTKRVARIVLVAPTLPFLLKTGDNPEGFDRSAFEHLRASWFRDFPKWLSDHSRPFFVPETSDEMIRWGLGMSAQTSLKAAIECNRAVTETDFRADLPKINVPTLIIQGDKDASAPLERTGRRTVALIPGSELRVYEGAPHGLMLTHIDRLNADLAAFIGS